ncbi:MAG: SGNH/GDSL hydrolase family protein [Pseudomonadota bacterium]
MLRLLTFVFFTLASTALASDAPRILILGDSFMTTNASAKSSVSHELARLTGARVKSRAVTGARFFYNLPITGGLGMNIPKQYRKGGWDIVVMNGGGNDLWMGCGCGKCTRKMQRLISADGSRGAIPSLVARARADGARVFYVGYLRSPGAGSPIEGCKAVGDRLEARVAQMAARDPGVTYVSLQDMIPYGDRSYHALDMIHPSPKGSRAAAERIARAIAAAP